VALVTIDFRILGRTCLRVGGEFTVDWGAPKERGVLAVLLLHAGKSISVRTLAEWVWSEDKAPRDPIGTLYTYTARIRAALRRSDVEFDLASDDGEYRLDVDKASIDYSAFRTKVGEARKASREGYQDTARALLQEALTLWQGEPLADLDTDRAANWRRVAIRDEWLSTNKALLQSLNHGGEFTEMLDVLQAIQVDHELDLLLAKLRLQALYALDRGDDAIEYYLDYYHRAKAAASDVRANELRGFHDRLIRPNSERRDRGERVGMSSGPENLPYGMADLAGRADLVAELDSFVTDRLKPRVITLDGLPGVGKTALAVQWAHRVRRRFPDGVWFVNLNGFEDGAAVKEDEVVTGLLEEFRMSADCPPTPAARRAKLREALTHRRMLVLLDNAHDAGHVEPLIPLFAGSVVVVTSRGRLSELMMRHGARCLTVPPLARDHAVEWLRERIGARALAEPEALTQLAALGGGLPLALGIIGEYVAVQQGRSLRDFVEQLKQRRAVLGLRHSGSRLESSLRAVFDCSYRDLAPEMQRLFRLLGIYPGLEFPLGVAAAIAGVPAGEVRAHLDGLVWARLLEAREGGRFAFHDLLRDYASERVEIEEEDRDRESAALRMTDWFLHTCNNVDRKLFSFREAVPMLPLSVGVEPLSFVDGAAALEWITDERAEISQVITYAAADKNLCEHVWRLVNVSLEAILAQGFQAEVMQGLNAAVVSAKAAGDLFGEAGSLANMGFACARFHDHAEAARCFRRAYELSESIDDRIGMATVLRNQAERASVLGDHAEAMALFDRALDIARQEDDLDTEAGVLHRVGEAMHRRGRNDEALTHLHFAWRLRERIGDIRGRGATFAAIALVLLDKDDHHGALGFAHRALVELRHTRQLALESDAAVVAAVVQRNLGDWERAGFYAELAVDLSRRARDPLRQARAQDTLGQVRHGEGRHREARACWELASGLYTELKDSRAFGIRAQLAEWVEPELPGARSETTEERSPIGDEEAT
jgi:tetratricopeptide (TPR) repeat protein/DNA-binding SARP family transcriptional activator